MSKIAKIESNIHTARLITAIFTTTLKFLWNPYSFPFLLYIVLIIKNGAI